MRRLLLAAVVILPAGCYQKMGEQPSLRPLKPSDFFADGRSSRPPVPGTVARGQLRIDTVLYTGRDSAGKLTTEYPFEITEAVLKRGKERYGVFCAVCHGLTGKGDGRIVQRGFTRPPDYALDDSRWHAVRNEKVKLIDVPVGHIFEVATKGFGAMPDYAEQVPVNDRWAITAYVRALQFSRSPEMRKEKGK
jgi:mono/diheme cytochrome c family protein